MRCGYLFDFHFPYLAKYGGSMLLPKIFRKEASKVMTGLIKKPDYAFMDQLTITELPR